MYSYGIEEWIIFFLIYSFIGWIYEEIFFLVSEKKLVNRGFMHGPFLPIYGAGAILILLVILPFGTNPFLVFVLGGLTATVLELLTGMAMEALFHVRYWDYSSSALNYKGYICWWATLVWCVASVLMVNCVQVPLGNLLAKVNAKVVYGIAHLFSIGFAADFALSFREAMDLRKILDTLTAENEDFARLVEEFNTKKAEFEARKEKLEADLSEMRDKAEFEFEKAKFNAESSVEHLKIKAEARAEQLMQQNEETAAMLKAEAGRLKEKQEANIEKLRTETEANIEQLRLKIEERKLEMHQKLSVFKTTSGYERIKPILMRNKIAAAKRYRKALEELKEHIEKH